MKTGESGGAQKREKTEPEHKLTAAELTVMQRQFASALDSQKLGEFAASLGLSAASLRKFEIGYCPVRRAWTFPMRDGERRLIGFRTRDAFGKKRCVTGSRTGLFLPHDLELRAGYELPFGDHGEEVVLPPVLLLPEGPTDAAAALDLGFRAIGRPSNMGGADQLRLLLGSGERLEIVIVADHDPVKRMSDGTPFVPGWEGALHLAEAILSVCGTLKVCRPPGKIKDLRDWMVRGGEAVVLKALIEDTETITRNLLREKHKKLDEWKRGIGRQRCA